MPNLLEQEAFLNPFFSLLEETFENHHGIFLDANTSLFQTLAGISAERASVPVGGKCATLAAQVAHIIFYLETLERYIFKNDRSRVDWGEIWETTSLVSPSEWETLQSDLKQVYSRLTQELHAAPDWNEELIGGALAIVTHTAYHLGEIRQAFCTLA